MINPKNGEYSPVAVYDRKLLRGMLRKKVEKEVGYHNVSGRVNAAWAKMKEVKASE